MRQKQNIMIKTIEKMKRMLSLKKHKDPLIHRTNAEEWRLEVERVAPSLKMTVKTDGR